MLFQVKAEPPERGIADAVFMIHDADSVDDPHMPGNVPVSSQKSVPGIVNMGRFRVDPVQLHDFYAFARIELFQAFCLQVEAAVIKSLYGSGNSRNQLQEPLIVQMICIPEDGPPVMVFLGSSRIL